jgi:spermidine synthase
LAALYALVFALTLLVSSALVFLVQPILGKMLLPSLGGTPLAWNICLVFFQAVLLLAYGYAHATTRLLGPRRQAVLHVVLLLLAAALLVLGAVGVLGRAPLGGHALALSGPDLMSAFLGLLLAAGLPFFVVAAGAPLLQRWLSASGHPQGPDPYFLYAAANLGSLLALVSYPVLVEPLLPLPLQGRLWLWGFAGMGLLLLLCAGLLWLSPHVFTPSVLPGQNVALAPGSPRPPTLLRRLRWLILSAVPVSLLLGLTTTLTYDIAPVPLLWVLPLALYLLTFILAFGPRSFVVRLGLPLPAVIVFHVLYGALILLLAAAQLLPLPAGLRWGLGGTLCVLVLLVPYRWAVALQPLAVLALVYQLVTSNWAPVGTALVIHLLAFYLTARVCHGALAQERPPAQNLTEFFLWLAAGGLLGGVFNLLLAPLLFVRALVEYPLALVLASMLRPAWLANGPSDWVLAKLCEAGAAHRGEPRRALRRGLAWLFDVALPILGAGATIGFFLALKGADLRASLNRGGAPYAQSQFLFNLIVFGPPLLGCLLLAARPLRFGLAVGLVLLVQAFISVDGPRDEGLLLARRGPFGIVRVQEQYELGGNPALGQQMGRYTMLMQGTTDEGTNFHKKEYRRLATTYYHRYGPAGAVLERFNWFGGPQNTYWSDSRIAAAAVGLGPDLASQLVNLWSEPPIGVIGLGTGTLASYARPFQHMDFFELDPQVVELSLPPPGQEAYFHFVADAGKRGADVRVKVGDGRLRLAAEGPDGFYHLLFVDGFNSDAIPVHLLTREAVELYLQKLAPHGLICFHVSNRHLDLVPVLGDVARQLGCVAWRGHDLANDKTPGHFSSEWLMMARSAKDLENLRPPQVPAAPFNQPPPGFGLPPEPFWQQAHGLGRRVWTDDFSNLAAALRPRQTSDAYALLEVVLGAAGLVLLLWLIVEMPLLSVGRR